MKNYILVAFLLLVGTPSISQNDLPIYNSFEVISELDKSKLSPFTISVPSSFNNEALDLPSIDFSNKKITGVKYFYSANTENPEFGQNELSNRRYEQLINKYPQLKNEDIEWNTYAQTGCAGKPCVEDLFHGFLIEYEMVSKPIEKRKTVEKPFQIGIENLPQQKFTVATNKTQVITGVKGTRVHIPSNAFKHKDGSLYNGSAVVMLQEAVDLEDIVLGNMETKTANGDMLMSKGMVNIEAKDLSGNELELRDGKALTVKLTTSFDPEYSYYEGVNKEDGSVTWDNPTSFVPEDFEGFFEGEAYSVVYEKGVHKVFKNKDGIITKIYLPLGNKTVKIFRSSFNVRKGKKKGLTRRESRVILNWFKQNKVNIDDLSRIKRNSEKNWLYLSLKANEELQKQREMQNIFQMKSMGWANIDCLARFKNSKKMRFEVNNISKGIGIVAISLVIPSIKSMISGWRKQNGNYSFTHGEHEVYALYPSGETAYVVATGEKDGEEYSAVQKVVFGEGEVQDFKLEKRDKDATKRLIKEVFEQRADS